jgi:hypothetical protein
MINQRYGRAETCVVAMATGMQRSGTRLSAERVTTEVKRFEPLSFLALGFAEASV